MDGDDIHPGQPATNVRQGRRRAPPQRREQALLDSELSEHIAINSDVSIQEIRSIQGGSFNRARR